MMQMPEAAAELIAGAAEAIESASGFASERSRWPLLLLCACRFFPPFFVAVRPRVVAPLHAKLRTS